MSLNRLQKGPLFTWREVKQEGSGCCLVQFQLETCALGGSKFLLLSMSANYRKVWILNIIHNMESADDSKDRLYYEVPNDKFCSSVALCWRHTPLISPCDPVKSSGKDTKDRINRYSIVISNCYQNGLHWAWNLSKEVDRMIF